jgi:SAM-dependent methyltransferase/acyl carrier protein
MDERDMREWVDTTVDRLLSFAPRRVLEIGCGTGLLLHRLAPAVECYVAIDFSPTVVKHVQDAAAASGLRNVMVRCANADALAQQHDIEPVDLVIINSVAQYFPGAEYLTRVLEQAVGMVRPGGVVFVGDVRNLQWLEAFHASIELVQAPSETPVPEFRRRVQERVSADPELVIAPEYFEAFGERVPTVGGVDVLLRHGKAHNEMTCFRYDALLFVGERQARRATQDVDGREMSLESIREQLARTDAAVTIRNIRNPRLVPTMTALRAAGRLEPTANVAELRRLSAEHASDGIEPDDLAGLCGCDVDIRPAASGTLDEYDATFWRRAAVNERILPALAPRPRPAALVHEPRPDRGQLVQTLKQHLRARLPGYMVPGAFVVLDALPLTPNGKIDRKVLPDPDRQRQESAAPYVAPAGDVERVIADTWQELLALERISTTDNFFDIGANSLLMVQAHAALRERLGRRLSLVDLFRFPTVAALAAHLDQAEAPGESAVLASSETRGQSRADALNRRRNLRQTARTGEGR